MRVALVLLLGGCSTDVHVQTLGTAERPMQVSVHDAEGTARSVTTTGDDGSAWLSEVERGDVVTVTAEHNDPVTYIWSESVVDVRPGDALVFDGVRPWDPSPDPPAESAEVLLEASELPPGGESLWMGLFECGLGPMEGPLTVRVRLSQCEGAVTPVAMALDGAGLPFAFQRLDAREVDELGGQTLRLDGPWRDDWEAVQVDVDGPFSGAVVTRMQMGRWLHYELHSSVPFTTVFRFPPGLGLEGVTEVSTREEDDDLLWSARVQAGDQLTVDLEDSLIAAPATLSSTSAGFVVDALGDAQTDALELTAVSSTPPLSHAWTVRMPAGWQGTLPIGFTDPDGFEDGTGSLAYREYERGGYATGRERGDVPVIRERTTSLTLP
ncbi:MAG: hypothetical protein KC912_12700 [Proteobacteria bacterium]|nr:hypothetical protein [Pseudomonadota bacterium]